MKSVMIISNNDWWYHNPTSPIQIAKELSKNAKVLFVNSIGFGMPARREKDFTSKIIRKFKSYIKLFRKVEKNLYVLTPMAIPSFGNSMISAMNRLMVKSQIMFALRMAGIESPACIVANPMFFELGGTSNRSKLLYFLNDKYDAKGLPNKDVVIEADRKMAETADVIVCVSRALYDYYKPDHRKVKLITHGVDYEHFSAASRCVLDCPEDMRDLNKPLVGFMGVIDPKTSDPDLLEYLFQRNPEKTFVFVGKLSNELTYLREHNNVCFLGQKHFKQLPSYLAQFDVALMPFNDSEWIRYCNPIKLKEYLAAGLPVVSINIKEAEPYGDVVYLASNYEEFHELLNLALQQDSQELKKARQRTVSNETWSQKVSQLESFF
jgi:glycosyltransferase involved in cell wall biosynthesis